MSSAQEPGEGRMSEEQVHGHLRTAFMQLEAVLGPERPADERAEVLELQAAARDVYSFIEEHQRDFEQEGGPLDEIVGLKPGLAHGVRGAQGEHMAMLHRAKELDTSIERGLAFDSFDIDLFRTQASVLRDTLGLHLMHANALAYNALFVDEGGEG